MTEKHSLKDIKEAMYKLDWIQIMKESVETRPSSWGVQRGNEAQAVNEWRNASDTLIGPVYKNLEEQLSERNTSQCGFCGEEFESVEHKLSHQSSDCKEIAGTKVDDTTEGDPE